MKRVFVMDDSAFALELVNRALGENGVEVISGRDLADLSRLEGSPVDLVLMDVEMPEIFGDDVTQFLRDQGQPADIYLLSSLSAAELAMRAEDCGAAGYIEKRLGLAGVVERVLALLGIEPPDHSSTAIALTGDFVSTARGRLRRAEGAIARNDPRAAAGELHALAGEAALLGRHTVAAAADTARIAAQAAFDAPEKVAAVTTALAGLADEIAAAAGLAPAARPRVEGQVSARVLLVDDSELYRSTLMSLLEDAGFEVVEARQLSEARHRMRDGHFDLAILDLQLEDGRGSDLIPDLRRHAKDARLVLLTGETTTPAGADLVLSKMMESEDLLRRLTELAARR